MAAEAVEVRGGCDPDGYRDYRGTPVVGAWTWLPDHDFGVATEMDRDEAFAPVFILRRAFWGLIGLLGLAAVGIFVAMLVMARQQTLLQAAVLQPSSSGSTRSRRSSGPAGWGPCTGPGTPWSAGRPRSSCSTRPP